MNRISKIKTLFSFEDGDSITPGMGVQIAPGHGLQQFYDSQTRIVSNTDFNLVTGHSPTLFPQAYSSKLGAIIEPDEGGQWYLNNITDNNGILDENGDVKAAFDSLFGVTTVRINNKDFPGLVIIDNLVGPNNNITTDIHIYYVGSYGGKQFTCHQVIPVQVVVGNAYRLQVSVNGASGYGDEVLSDDNDWVEYSAQLQIMSTGTTMQDAVISFEHLGDNGWETVTNQTRLTEVSISNGVGTLKLYEAAVNGSELYRAKAVYLGKTYYQAMNPTDEHDPYYIVDGCSIAGDTVQRGETVTWNPKVMKRHYDEEDEDVTVSEGWTFAYTLVSQRTGETITGFDQTGITFDRLNQNGGIATRITATRP